MPVKEINKTLPQALVDQSIQELRYVRERLYKIFRKSNREEHLILWKITRADFKVLARKTKKEDWVKYASYLNKHTPINQAWNIVTQLKGKDPKK